MSTHFLFKEKTDSAAVGENTESTWPELRQNFNRSVSRRYTVPRDRIYSHGSISKAQKILKTRALQKHFPRCFSSDDSQHQEERHCSIFLIAQIWRPETQESFCQSFINPVRTAPREQRFFYIRIFSGCERSKACTLFRKELIVE